MFRLVRWVFMAAIIVLLAGFVVGVRVWGKTPAEGFCKLVENPVCFQVASRGENLVKEARRRWLDKPVARAGRREVAESTRASRALPGTAPAPSATPLDRHTPAERKALTDLLEQHGSR